MANIDPLKAPDVVNLAENMDEDRLDTIGRELVEMVREDESSRSGWVETNEKWLMLAAQVMEDKNFPWPNAANVKYPLLTMAAIQFHARAYPALIDERSLVKTGIRGADPDGEKRKRAERVRQYMNYQLLDEIEDWQDEMDRLLLVLSIAGLAYKKTYYSQARGRIVSEYVLPQDLVVNYHAINFERARRTHKILLDDNTVKEYVNQGIFRDVDLGHTKNPDHSQAQDKITNTTPSVVEQDKIYEFYETHWFWDFDDDGYKEPYIVTVESASGKVVRIVARYAVEDIETDARGKIIKIKPIEHFTQYVFIPDPNSKLYGMGFGALVGPMNHAVNTLTNQLLDAGTLNNLQGGFLGKGVRIRGGAVRFSPGEWKTVNTTGDDLRKGIYPLPVKEPSSVLFSLLGMLVQSAERLASVNDIMTGENPGQNQPFSTTMAVLEQGLKVFSSIFKRIHRALGKEYRKIYHLNKLYLDEKVYFELLDSDKPQEVYRTDFEEENMDIRPASDSSVITDAQKLLKAESLLQKLSMGLPLNVEEVTRRALEAEGHEDISALMGSQEQEPDPELLLKQAELEHKIAMDEEQLQLDKERIKYEAMKDESQAVKNLVAAEVAKMQTQIQEMLAQLKSQELDQKERFKDRDDFMNALGMDMQAQQAMLSNGPEEEPTPDAEDTSGESGNTT